MTPKESAPTQVPSVATWKHEALAPPMPSDAKMVACSPSSRPTEKLKYGCALETAALPPNTVKIPSEDSMNVPRYGFASSPVAGAGRTDGACARAARSEEHTSELQSRQY